MTDYNSDDLQGKEINLMGSDKDYNVGINKNQAIDNDVNKFEDIEGTSKLDRDTLDEPIMETLKRDLIKIIHKIEYVMIPRTTANENKQLRNWDFWGPLLLCLILSILLSFGSNEDSGKGMIFVMVFVLVWLGGVIVTMNCHFLGSKISLFQSICVLGYCLFPIDVAALLIALIPLPVIIKFIISGFAFVWSSISSIGFMSQMISPKKKILAAYPIFLFYLFFSCLIMAL